MAITLPDLLLQSATLTPQPPAVNNEDNKQEVQSALITVEQPEVQDTEDNSAILEALEAEVQVAASEEIVEVVQSEVIDKDNKIIEDFNFNLRLQNALNEGTITEEDVEYIKQLRNKELPLCSTPFEGDKYEIVNGIIFGPQKDGELNEYLENLGKKYGVDIYSDNNLVSEAYAAANGEDGCRVMTLETLQELEATFEAMRAHGQEIPKEIYMTELFDNAGGYFTPWHPNAIYMNTEFAGYTEYFANVLPHEAAHMADYNPETGETYSLTADPTINLDGENSDLGSYSDKVSVEDIEKYIGCTTNNVEFVAVVTQMITTGVIIRDSDGNYAINPAKMDESGNYRDGELHWDGTQEDVEALNRVLDLYNHLTKNKTLTTPTIRRVDGQGRPSNWDVPQNFRNKHVEICL